MERKSEPVEIQPTFVINNSQVTQILTRSIEYTTTKTEFYETTKEEQYGVKGESHKIHNSELLAFRENEDFLGNKS